MTSASKVNRTAVWAVSAGIPIAVSTCEASSLPAAQAEPLEQTMPCRSRSSRTDSPLRPGSTNEA